MNIVQLANFIVDFLLALWFFRPIKPYPGRSTAKTVLSLLLFAFLIPIYLNAFDYNGGVLDTILRFVLRTAVYTIYVHSAKGRSWGISLCIAAIAWLTFTAGNNILLTPMLMPLRFKELAFSQSYIINYVICELLEFAFYFVIITLVSRLTPLDAIRRIPPARVQVLSAMTIIEIYVKLTLARLNPTTITEYETALTVYPFIMQFLALAALVFFERYMFSRTQQEQQHMNELAARYRVEYAQASRDADSSIRRLHHDLNNHLNTILRLSGDNARLDAYVQKLLEDGLEDYESLVSTGNSLLDGLISAKIRRARKESISVSANVDFRDGGFLADADICTIFGNALDNAIEAGMQVKDPDKRSLLIRCGSAGESLNITISNYFEGELKRESDILLSRKTEAGHGLGLSSIRSAVKNYGGVMAVSADDLHNFILTISIPIPETAETSASK